MERRFAFGEINAELYKKYSTELVKERVQIQQRLDGESMDITNLDKGIKKAVDLSCNLHTTW